MHFSTLALAILPALTLAAPFEARSPTGSWFFSLSKSYYANGYHSQTVFANYTSDSYPSGLVTNCKYVQDPTQSPPVDSASCDQEGFSWTYDNEVVKLQQVLDKPTPMTVFGDAPLTLTSNAAGRGAAGNTTVVVTSAIA